ncbi:hypothetical protein J6590_101433 [Homalodisca vitripennis]|nr:hypothetical protein J6590_101433 [Homalodisca vitripennis]
MDSYGGQNLPLYLSYLRWVLTKPKVVNAAGPQTWRVAVSVQDNNICATVVPKYDVSVKHTPRKIGTQAGN